MTGFSSMASMWPASKYSDARISWPPAAPMIITLSAASPSDRERERAGVGVEAERRGSRVAVLAVDGRAEQAVVEQQDAGTSSAGGLRPRRPGRSGSTTSDCGRRLELGLDVVDVRTSGRTSGDDRPATARTTASTPPTRHEPAALARTATAAPSARPGSARPGRSSPAGRCAEMSDDHDRAGEAGAEEVGEVEPADALRRAGRTAWRSSRRSRRTRRRAPGRSRPAGRGWERRPGRRSPRSRSVSIGDAGDDQVADADAGRAEQRAATAGWRRCAARFSRSDTATSTPPLPMPEQGQADDEVRVVVEELERDDPRVADLEQQRGEADQQDLDVVAAAVAGSSIGSRRVVVPARFVSRRSSRLALSRPFGISPGIAVRQHDAAPLWPTRPRGAPLARPKLPTGNFPAHAADPRSHPVGCVRRRHRRAPDPRVVPRRPRAPRRAGDVGRGRVRGQGPPQVAARRRDPHARDRARRGVPRGDGELDQLQHRVDLDLRAAVRRSGSSTGSGGRASGGARHAQDFHVVGSDASGVVLRVGSAVRNWKPGRPGHGPLQPRRRPGPLRPRRLDAGRQPAHLGLRDQLRRPGRACPSSRPTSSCPSRPT